MLVEAGYIEESGPDQPPITSSDDVFDLVRRAMAGERIVPLADQQPDNDYEASLNSRDAEKQLAWAEKEVVLPAIERYDEETGDPILSQTYRKLKPDERIAVIEAVRRGEDVSSAIEEIIVANVDVEAVQAMVAAYGPNPALIERIRTMIAQQQPDLLVGFDDMVAQFPTRRAKVAREPARRAGDEPTELVRGMGRRLQDAAADPQAFNLTLGELESDRKIYKDDAFRIATDFLGQPPKKGTRASYFQQIRNAQAASQGGGTTGSGHINNRSIFAREGEEALRATLGAQSRAVLEDTIKRRTLLKPDRKLTKDQLIEQLVADARRAQEERFAAASGGGVSNGGLAGGERSDTRLSAAPAVPVQQSVRPEALVSLIDGTAHTDLRPYLKKKGIEIDDYARNYRLADDYPMVAENVIAEKHGATRQTQDYDTFRKKFTVGGIRAAAEAKAAKVAETAGRAAPSPTAKGFATQVQAIANKLSTPPFQDRVSIAQVYDEYKKQNSSAESLEDFKKNLVKAASVDRSIQLGRLDLPERMERSLRDRSTAMWGRDEVHTVIKAADPQADRDLMQEIIRLANSKTPRDRWAQELGLQPVEMHRAVTEAVQAGILAYDKRGVARRAPMDQRKDAKGILAEYNALLDEAMPTETSKGGRQVPVMAAVQNWSARANMLVQQLKTIPLADAQALAPKLLGRKVGKTEVSSRPKIVELVTHRLNSITSSRIGASQQQGSAALVAPGQIGGENVMLTPQAQSKIEQLQAIADEAVDGILPRHMRADVKDSIAVARLAREDELFALRSSASDMMAETEAGDELQGDGEAAGKEGAAANQGSGSRSIAAAVGGGQDTRDARILRQESATLFPDGAIRTGRFSGAPGSADARASDAGAVQQIGTFEAFDADGFTAVVSAANVTDHQSLAARGARPSEYRLATLTYRLYDKAAGLKPGRLADFKPNFRANGDSHAPLVWARVSQHMDGTWEVSMVQRIADKDSAPRGMSAKLYALIERDLGIKMSPSGLLSEQGHAMWQKRSPESVKWHQWSDFEGYYISPRRIKDNLDAIGKEMRAIKQRPEADPDRERDLDNARKERGELIKLWGKMPVEARAETPNMFSLPGFFSPVLRAAERLKQDKGSGDQFLKAILATPGVKADEVSWIGLEQFLKSKESISKGALMSFIKGAGTKMDERVLGQSKLGDVQGRVSKIKEGVPFLDDVDVAVTTDEFGVMYDPTPIAVQFPNIRSVWRVSYPDGDWFMISALVDNVDEVIGFRPIDDDGRRVTWDQVGRWAGMSSARHGMDGNWHDRNNSNSATFSAYKVPGGSNYREFLLRVPEIGENVKLSAEQETELAQNRARQRELRRQIDNDPGGGFSSAMNEQRAEMATLARREREIIEPTRGYESKHFNDSEIAHIRVDDRKLPDGRRVLFINEVQSDLHQQARHVGYIGQESQQDREARYQVARAEFLRLTDEYGDVFDRAPLTPERRALRDKVEKARKKADNLADAPFRDAPFKGDLYLELALKRMLQEAIEGGYDAISWARPNEIASAVGAKEAGMNEQYDKKIRRFYDKYTKQYGGKVDVATGVTEAGQGLYSFDTLESMLNHSSEAMGVITRAADTAEVDEVDSALRTLMQTYDSGAMDGFTMMATMPEDALAWLDKTFQEMRLETRETSGNQILAITPAMREQIPVTGQPLYSLSNGDRNQALGQTDPIGETISLGAKAIEQEARASGRSMAEVTRTAARHEALEFFLYHQIISAAEWQVLQRTAIKEGWVDATGVREAYTAQFGATMGKQQLEDLIVKESVMEMYGRYRADQYKPKGMIRMAFKRVSDFLERLTSGLRGEGFQRWEDIFQKADQGELRRRYEEIFGRTDKVNTQAMIRAGVLPDARGIAQAPGATRVTQPHGRRNAAQGMVQRFLPRQRPLKALSELMADFSQAAGLSVRTGRISQALQRQATQAGGGRVLGQYEGVARLRVQRDFDTFSHEAGHHLERTLGGALRVAMTAFAHELNPMASMVAGAGNTSLSEGFAEFFRKYLTNETAARQQAPGFYRAFENLVEAQDPRLFWTMQDIQDEYDNFLLGDPLDRGAAQQTVITRPTGVSGAVRRFFADAERDGFVSTMGERLYDMHHGFVQNVFDKRHGWWMATRALLDEINRTTGQRITLAAADNPNKLIKMTSHTQAWAMQDLKEGIALRSRPNGGGVSMHQVLATAFGGTARSAWNEARARAFGDYLIARRAVHLYIRHRPQMRTVVQQFVAANPQLNFLLARLPNNTASELERPPTAEPLYEHLNRLLRHNQQNPQFRQAAELYYQFNKDLIQLMYEKGLITQEERAEYQQDRDYAPFQRNMEDRELVDSDDNRSRRPPRGRDKSNKYDVYRRIEGSMRDIINPIQSTVQTMFEIRLRAAINDTLRAMDRVARQAGRAGNEIFERLPPTEARAVEVRIREQLRQAARAAGMTAQDTAIMLANVETQIGQNVVTTMFTQAQASEKGEKIVWFFENGKPIPAQLPDGSLGQMMFEGLTAVGQRNMGQIMDAMATVTGVVRTGVTLSFGFVFRNIVTDAIASAVNSPYARPFLTQAAGIREIVTGGRYLHMYNRYAGMMGGAGHAALSDQSIQRDIEGLRQRGFQVRVPRSLGDFIKLIFQVGEFSETATRVGIFRNAMRSAQADGMSPFDAAIEAGHYAHDVMDFSQHGSKTEAFRRVIPFFNAALQGLYKYGKTLTAANDYGNLIQIWNRQMQGLPLSRNEQRALGQAGKAWMISTVVLGGISLIFCLLGADDDDMKEVPDTIRATHWMLSLNGVLHLLPKDMRVFLAGEDERTDWLLRIPKPFEIAWFANGVERAWDYLVNNDPNAANGMANDFFTTLLPPHSIPALDTFYGFATGKDMYSGNSIVPIWEQGPEEIERKQQFGPYTSWTAKQIGEQLNMSPYYVDFLIRNLTTSVGQDATSGIDSALGEGPMPSIAEYPVARRFTYNAGKSSKSMSTFYNMMTDGEGLNKWFWNTFTDDARSFHSAGNTYKKMVDAGGENSAQAAEFLSQINPDQRVYAILENDFKGRSQGKYRNLHPMINASASVKVANAIMKEVVEGELIQEKGGKEEVRKPMDREQMRFARNEIAHIRKGMAQNALKILGVDGWREQKLMDVDARLETLKAGAPDVYTEMMRRLKKEKVQDGKHLAKVWPQVKERIEAQRKDAEVSDLYGEVVGDD